MDRITLGSVLFAAVETFVLLWFIGMLASWAWAIGRLWTRRPILEDRKEPFPRPAPWGFLSVVAVCLLYVLLGSTVKRVYEGSTDPAAAAATKEPFGGVDVLAPVAIVSGLTVLLAPVLLRLTCGANWSDLGLAGNDWGRQVRLGIVGGLMATPGVLAIQALAVRIWSPQKHPVEEMLMGELTVGSAALALVSTMILAPMVEEILFRGILQRWLIKVSTAGGPSSEIDARRDPMVDDADVPSQGPWELEEADAPGLPAASDVPPIPGETLVEPADVSTPPAAAGPEDRVGIWMGIVLTSVVFASLHWLQWPAPIAIFLLSLALGVVYQKTGHLLTVIAMHGTFNGFSTMVMLLQALQPHGAPALKGIPKTAFIGCFSWVCEWLLGI
ncbi:CPBP family intramembrane glutamic endopeptidase [Aquisphaera insulae]|uniref:CPBP family intramembrane glutamic endopeptidase n=1 Tax=Aquisphaera insulae TaxID=2712864 RepID=UPI0013EB9C1A|nr:CPBP family intramembrane glutamic endopeptidase [Aquisphaera insulae]